MSAYLSAGFTRGALSSPCSGLCANCRHHQYVTEPNSEPRLTRMFGSFALSPAMSLLLTTDDANVRAGTWDRVADLAAAASERLAGSRKTMMTNNQQPLVLIESQVRARTASIGRRRAVWLLVVEARGLMSRRLHNRAPRTLASSPVQVSKKVHVFTKPSFTSTLNATVSRVNPSHTLYMPSSTSLYTIRDVSSSAQPQQRPSPSPLPVLRHTSLPSPLPATCRGYSRISSSTRMTKKYVRCASRRWISRTETSDRVPAATR